MPNVDERLTEAARPHVTNLLTLAGKAPAQADPGDEDEASDGGRPATSADNGSGSSEKDDTPHIVVAGKTYASEEAQRAAHEHAQTLITELQAEGRQMRELLIGLATQKAQADAGKPADDPLEKEMQKWGVPVETLNALIDARARKIAAEEASRKVDPIVAGNDAEAYMRSNFEGYAEHAEKVNEFVMKDLMTQKIILPIVQAGDIQSAKVIAWTRYVQANRPSIEAPAAEAAAAAKAARSQAKRDGAMLPANKSNRSMATKGEGDIREKLSGLAAEARKTGNEREYLSAAVQATYPDVFAYFRNQPR